jgi:membrane fusion protein (multidrug efflux system)
MRHALSSRFSMLALVIGALALGACGKEEAPAAAAGSAAPPPAEVTVVTLKPETVTLTRELPGRINAFLVAEVRPQVNGIVKERLFTEGERVKAGQPLYQLDDATYRAEHASARAALTRAKASLESARLTAKRSEALARIDAVSRQDNENAIAALRLAEADVAAAEAALQGTQVTLGHARIDSPISGQIGKSTVTQGALVTANQAVPLATVQQLDPVYADLTQSSSELLQLRKELAAGTLTSTRDVPVTILLEDGAPYSHDGKFTFADVTVDPATGSFLLRVLVPNPDNILLPGMYVRAVVSVGERQNALLVPQQGVARDPKGNTTAMVVSKEGTAEQRAVQTSRTIGDKWLVDGGLAAGDRVIVEGLQKIRPGAPVNASEATAVASATATPGTGLAQGSPAAAGTAPAAESENVEAQPGAASDSAQTDAAAPAATTPPASQSAAKSKRPAPPAPAADSARQ